MNIPYLKTRLAWLLFQWSLCALNAYEGIRSGQLAPWLIALGFLLFGISAFINVIPFTGAQPFRAVLLDERYRKANVMISGLAIVSLLAGMWMS
ncbi:hypothetical protein [Chitinimonas sp. BJYL2]|uniref:hypothetical protein n=1 Tax=Chitinimonas sp. BJYL2 TaxID=2976696 RepID=UPI0022B5E349|nr:hypothetical protein [Chitinimonas sp. BJYL2]